jgi:predicted nucleic acid-binding protein
VADYLSDTNCSFRRIMPGDALYSVVTAAFDHLHGRGDTVYTTPQILVEYQALATRPISANGLGLSPNVASQQARLLESFFPMLPEMPEIYQHWRTLVDKYQVQGRQVYDARLVAVMITYRIPNLLTFNTTHFTRFSEINVFSPNDIITP